MPVTIKLNSRQTERTDDGNMTTVSWTGEKEEILSFAQSEEIGSIGSDGELDSVRIYAESPKIWCCEKKYLSDSSGEARDKPNTVYGKKSAQLHGSMLSMPLEANSEYKTKWNYYLAGAKGVDTVPGWWGTAKDTILSFADSQKYAWIKSLGETPVDKNGRWHVIKEPTKPGLDSYDVAVYSVTEVAKFRTARKAGAMVSNVLNRIGTPMETFGSKTGNWKCDDASVSYDGKNWYATMTWTRSGNSKGWDSELYEDVQ